MAAVLLLLLLQTQRVVAQTIKFRKDLMECECLPRPV